MASPFRTKEMTAKHEEYKLLNQSSIECPLCTKKPLKDFKFWKIVDNSFPYDLVSSKSHLLVPKRHVTEEYLSLEEVAEFKEIKRTTIYLEYDYIIECTPKEMSVPQHFHLHILVKK